MWGARFRWQPVSLGLGVICMLTGPFACVCFVVGPVSLTIGKNP